MNLTDMLTAATTGTATLTDSNGATAQITATMAARLWTAIADDRTALSLYGLPEVGKLSVTGEDCAESDAPIVKIGNTLRYMLDGDDALFRLCTAPGCAGESTGATLLTRVCTNHLNVILPGMLPAAGDDIRPGDREDAAKESRQKRLDSWEAEIDERERNAAGDRRVLAQLRQGD